MFMNRIKLKRLWEFTKGFRMMYVVSLLCVMGNVVFNYAMPLVTAWTVDGVLEQKTIAAPAFVLDWVQSLGGRSYFAQNLWICGLALIALTVLRGVFAFFSGKLTAQASEGIVMRIKNALYRHLQSLPYDYHVKAETGDLIQRCTTDVDTVRRFLAGQLMELGRAILILIFAVSILVKINGALTIIAVSLMPLAILFSYFYSKRIQGQFQIVDEADGALSTVLQENLTGVRVVRAFGNEAYELEKFEKSNGVLRTRLLKLQNHFAQFWATSDFIAMTQQAVVLFACLYFIIERGMSVGSFIVFNTYIGMMIWPIRQMGRILADAAKMIIAIGRIDEVLRERPETSGEGAVAPDIRGDIVFSHVNFGYQTGKPVLRDISFTARQGQTVAILGATGSGKSTIVHLLQRLYEYHNGSIRINGTELNTIEKSYLRSKVGIVLQEPFLYSKTIAQNIGIISEHPDLAKVEEVARVAAVHDVICSFDQGYETLVGERGVTLSGGQKQRVAIARTLMKDNDILIFDDSLSAVDTETDMAIRRELKKRRKGVTTFIISHRISTLAEADLILVLEEGRITQSGSHEELVAQEGLYQRIWNIQNALEEEMQEQLAPALTGGEA